MLAWQRNAYSEAVRGNSSSLHHNSAYGGTTTIAPVAIKTAIVVTMAAIIASNIPIIVNITSPPSATYHNEHTPIELSCQDMLVERLSTKTE